MKLNSKREDNLSSNSSQSKKNLNKTSCLQSHTSSSVGSYDKNVLSKSGLSVMNMDIQEPQGSQNFRGKLAIPNKTKEIPKKVFFTIPFINKKVKREKINKFFRNSFVATALLFLFSFIVLLVGLLYIINSYSQDLPNLDKYLAVKAVEGKESIIVDRNNNELYRIRGEAIKERVDIDGVPDYLKWAFIAAEDAEFYEHTGLNTTGLMRAILCHATDRSGVRNCGGGSSITQQLIKNATDEKDRTFERKVREAVLAREIEQKLSKDEILEFYMNVVPEGGILYGVKSGAKYMFGKENLNDLTLEEMAYLAGIPNQPSVFSPWGGDRYIEEQGKARAIYVLERMRAIKDKVGITDYEIDEAVKNIKDSKVAFKGDFVDKKAPHYVDYVMSELNDIYSEYATETEDGGRAYLKDKGYIIKTSVDLETQELLENHLKETVPSEEFQNTVGAQNASGVIIDPKTGELLALVGSRDYRAESTDPKFSPVFNVALSPRSMGSTMKPPLYLSYFMQGYHQYSKLFDIGGINMELDPSAPDYYPQNYSRTFGQFGSLPTVYTSLQYSLNVPAVATYNVVGRDNYVDTFKKLNNWGEIENQIKGASAPLGAANVPLLNQTHAYATMASEGVFRPIKSIITIEDKEGNIVFDNRQDRGRQVIEAKYVHMINEVNQNYWLFNSDDLLIDIKKTTDIGGKTGTSDNTEGRPGDNIFISYTPNIVIGIWAGNSCGIDECPLDGSNATGEGLYSSLYKPFLEKYRSKIPEGRFSDNLPGLVDADICPESGMIYDSTLCPSPPVRAKISDTAVKFIKEEQMFKKYNVAVCDGVEKLVRDEDKSSIKSTEKIYFNYIYPHQSIMDEVNNVVGQKVPTDFCKSKVVEDTDNNATESQLQLISPLGDNLEFNTEDNINVVLRRVSNSDIKKVEMIQNNLILETITGTLEEYNFVVSLDERFDLGDNTLRFTAYFADGEEYSFDFKFILKDKVEDTTIITTPTPSPSLEITSTPIVTPTSILSPNEEDNTND